MKFLVDMPLSTSLSVWLREMGHDGIHAAELGLNQATDADLLTLAIAEDRILITADLDFPRLISQLDNPVPGLILLRHGNFSESEARECVSRVLMAIQPEHLEHRIVMVNHKQIRVRELPLR